MRKAIPPGERLAVTLLFLATGDSFRSLMYLFRIPANTISLIIPQVCEAIFNVLKYDYLKMPNGEDWKAIACEFREKWNFPNCLGALDGKHIKIQAPSNSGSLYFNYKNQHSIVLMGLADANYKFININVGTPGRQSDGGVFANCSLNAALNNNTVGIPPPCSLPESQSVAPFVVIGDDAFAMKPYLSKPYAHKGLNVLERVFNYRLSRARRVIENSFGLINARFRVLRRTSELQVGNVKKVVCAICVLHNFLLCKSKSVYAPVGTLDKDNGGGTVTDGTWREVSSDLIPLETSVAKNASLNAKQIRDLFKEYFCGEGEVPWQYKHV